MNKFSLLILSCLLAFASCSSSDEESAIMMVKHVDVSDLTVYRGSDTGAVKVHFNNLKKTALIKRFMGNVVTMHSDKFIEFNGSKLVYTYNDSLNGISARKIVSDYLFKDDSLFIVKSDKSHLFVALGDKDHLYRMKGFVRYPLHEPVKDTLRPFDATVGVDKALELGGYSSLRAMTNPADTILWCNIYYLFD